MKKKWIAFILCIIILAVDFYLLPCLINDTGMAMIMILCVMPLIAFICSLIYGVRQGFNILLPVAAVILFLPTVFIYYNESAWVYAVIYGIVSVAGNSMGRLFYKKR